MSKITRQKIYKKDSGLLQPGKIWILCCKIGKPGCAG
jgi:hypothetical protein